MIEVSRLMRYNQYLRHAYLDTLRGLPWAEVVADRGASFDSLRNIFVHCIAVFDFANRLLQDNEPAFPQIAYDDYPSITAIQQYMERVEAKFNPYVSALTPAELARKVTRTSPSGATTTATVEDYLLHFFQEETHHRGEFIALLYQMEVTPPHMGWLQYLPLEG